MKTVRKILISVGVFLAIMVAAAFIIPMIFKNDIKAAVDKELAKRVNADVIFDVNNFSLSVFRHFPSITVEVKELGVFNRAPFEGIHLFVVDRLDVEVNPLDVLFGDKLRLKGITLVRPQINVRVLKDGQANYNITFPTTDTVKTENQEPSQFSFGIDHWEIVDGELVYDDQSLPYNLTIKGLQHSGSGDFTQDVFDLRTHTLADTVTTSYGAMPLLTRKRVEIDAVVSISEDITKYTFKQNSVKVNDFAMSFDGWFKMNEKDFGMDITFKSPENTFKSLLSLVPGMYSKDFSKIETQGDLSFSGMVKGVYSDQRIPAFAIDLKVNDGMFKYPDLPTAISHIAMELAVANQDGVMNNTVVDLKKLHLDFGANPVDARLRIENLKDYRMDGTLKAKLNLAELNTMFPMQGIEMKGMYSIDATAKGIYDSLKKTIPAVNASMALTGGYVKSSQFPLPLQDLKFDATIKNTTGKMAETVIAVQDFSMLLDNEKLSARMTLQNLDDYTWDIKANGGVDLEKMTKIFPVEGMSLSGKVKANLETKGKMSDVNARRYDRLPTSGTASLTDFKYSSKTLPYAVTLSRAELTFDPRKMELKQMTGTIGKSDFDVKGSVMNYMGYILGQGDINGTVTYASRLLDLNEFMTGSPTDAGASDTASLHVVPVPDHVDFVFKSKIQTVRMTEYLMSDASGDIVVKNGVANLSGLKFNLLDGAFLVNGSYDTKDMHHPKYDFGLKIDHLSIQQAATSFSIVKTYAPVAGMASGNFNADLHVAGGLRQDMSLDLATVNSAGQVKILEATLAQSKVISAITAVTKLEDTDKVSLKDVLLNITITNGRLSVKPFDAKFGTYKTTVAGSTGLDGSIDYTLKTNVPAGKLGAQYQTLINQYAGTNNSTTEIPVTIGLGGTLSNPKTTLVTEEQKQQVKEAATKAAEQKGKEEIQKAVKGTEVESAVNSLLGVKTDSTKTKDSTQTAKPAEQLLQNKLQNLLKKKK